MLRLDLKDENETVLFIDPQKGVKIYKDKMEEGLFIDALDSVSYATYESKECRDAAYEHILTAITECLVNEGVCW